MERNILYIVYTSTIFKTESGGGLRTTLFAKALASVGHVDVVCFTQDDAISNIDNCDVIYSKNIADHHSPYDSLRTLLMATVQPSEPYSYYNVNKQKESIVDAFVTQKNYDIIACRYVENAIKCGLLKYKDKLVIDADDNLANVLYFRAIETNSRLERWLKRYKSRRIGSMVRKFLDSIPCSFCSNPVEELSTKTTFLHNTTILNQALPYPTSQTHPRILFVGPLAYFPNLQGITHFAKSIFPIVKKAIPESRLYIVGKGNKEQLAYLNSIEGVTAVGWVEDLTTVYQDASVVVIPLYYGSGSSIKFIESQFLSRPVVSTSKGARGFNDVYQANIHYMLANDDEDFANKTISLLLSPVQASEMAKQGYSIANKYFSQERFIDIVKNKILSLWDK